MQQLINFFLKFKTALVFWALFVLAIALTINANTYHQNKWLSSTNTISSFVLGKGAAISDYFYLKQENKKLMDENKRMKHYYLFQQHQAQALDSLTFDHNQPLDSSFEIINAKVIANSYRKINNYLLIEALEDFDLSVDVGVVSPQGIVGVVEDYKANFARVISVLNPSISINAQLAKTKHFGSLVWDGKDPNVTTLIDVPRSASVAVGDLVETGGNSLIFPEGIPVGEVIDFQLDNNRGYYNIQVKLHTDMTNVRNVYMIQWKDKETVLELIPESNE